MLYSEICVHSRQSSLAVLEKWPNYTNTTLFGIALAGWFIQVNLIVQVHDMAGLDKFHCIIHAQSQ